MNSAANPRRLKLLMTSVTVVANVGGIGGGGRAARILGMDGRLAHKLVGFIQSKQRYQKSVTVSFTRS